MHDMVSQICSILISIQTYRNETAWSGLSILIDFGIMFIPYAIIRQVQLDNYKKKILMMVFAASFLGTIAW